VPDDGAILIYDSAPIRGHAASSVPILISIGSYANIRTMPTAVPSPLPSPASSPQASLYAVALPTLEPSTTYQVYAKQKMGCTNATGPGASYIGSFTTQ
jgi:hypothetical protein